MNPHIPTTNPRWHLVTGTREAIYTTARDSYFADLEADLADDDFLHTENFILVDKDWRIRGVYNGTLAFDVQRLIEDIAILRTSIVERRILGRLFYSTAPKRDRTWKLPSNT